MHAHDGGHHDFRLQRAAVAVSRASSDFAGLKSHGIRLGPGQLELILAMGSSPPTRR